MTPTLGKRERHWLAALVVFAFAVRLATLGAYPLMDSTEARYAEIARKMAETGEWVTPQFDYGVPFWGKPPLSTWLTATSIGALGANEFAARFPALVLLVGVAALVWHLGRSRGGCDHALWSTALFSTMVLPFVAAGSAMTDPALALGTTLTMAGCWNAIAGNERGRRRGGIAFVAGLAIGLLAKGPVALVVTLLPLTAWALWTRQWRVVATRLPWLGGTLFTLAAVVPWYWLAESRTPGFLAYFLVGEHWHRFLDSGWKGDRYGAAHAHPRGLIWLLGFAALLPWSIRALAGVTRAIAPRAREAHAFLVDPWRAYLLFWTLAPLVFFTFAGNILWTYVLPAAPAFAILVADCWRPAGEAIAAADDDKLRRRVVQVVAAGALVPAAFAIGTVVLQEHFAVARSHKALVAQYEAHRGDGTARLVYYRDRPPSADFYARGKTLCADDITTLRRYLDDDRPDFLVLSEADLSALPAPDRARLERVGRYGEDLMVRERGR